MEARIQQLDQVVQLHEQGPVNRLCVLPVLRSSPLRCLQAWVKIAAFRRTQRMVLRRSYLDSVSMTYTSWRRNTFPRVGRHELARQLEHRTSGFTLLLPRSGEYGMARLDPRCLPPLCRQLGGLAR